MFRAIIETLTPGNKHRSISLNVPIKLIRITYAIWRLLKL